MVFAIGKGKRQDVDHTQPHFADHCILGCLAVPTYAMLSLEPTLRVNLLVYMVGRSRYGSLSLVVVIVVVGCSYFQQVSKCILQVPARSLMVAPICLSLMP
jgi:hypothetical protein